MRKAVVVGIVALLATLSLFVATSSAAPPNNTVHVFVIVPVSYTSPITPSQAWTAMITWLGQPTDEPCLGTNCTIEGYFRSQTSQVFDYDITIVSGNLPQPTYGGVDACGQGGVDSYWWRNPTPDSPIYDNRTFALVLGGGGWAGHNPGTKQTGAFGMIGDWGVQNMFDVPLSCVPGWVGKPFMDRGMAHEFEGMMGAFRHGATYDYFCCERAYEAQHRRNVLTWSRDWLRDPGGVAG